MKEFVSLQFVSGVLLGFSVFQVISKPLGDVFRNKNNEPLSQPSWTDSQSKCAHLSSELGETEISLGIRDDKSYNRFENVTTSGDNNVFNIPSGVEIDVKCVSKSPVTIKFHGLLANPVLDASTSRKYSEDVWTENSSNFCFEARVLLQSSHASTGRYECVNFDTNVNPNISGAETAESSQFPKGDKTDASSIYIFAGGNRNPHLLHAGKSPITVMAFPGDKGKLVLPCITNNASIKIRLFKNGQQLELTEGRDDISYDPMTGFTISNASCGENYICTDNINLADSSRNVRISITCPAQNVENQPKPEFKMAKFRQSNGVEAMEYRCLESTSMSVVECKNLLECEFVKSCGSSVHQRICTRVTDVCEGGNITSSNCLSITTSPTDQFRGLIFCSNEKHKIQMEIFSDVQGNKAFDFDFVQGIARPKRNPPYEKWLRFIPTLYNTWNNVGNFNLFESTRFQCNVSKVVGADGIEFLFQLGNGTKITALTSDEAISSQNFDAYSKSVDVNFNHSEISKLICRAPRLYSKGWHEISHDITMHPYLPLQLLEPLNETKQVTTENAVDDDHRLSCTALGTNTVFSWKKNDKVVAGSHDVSNVRWNDTLRRSTIVIVYDASGNRALPTATTVQGPDHTHDIYSCTVKNYVLNQTLTKYFRVEWIKPKPHVLLICIIVGVITACLAIMGIAYKFLKSRMENKALEKIRKEFLEGAKTYENIEARSNNLSRDANEYESEKPSKILPGDPNYYRTLPYNIKFEIPDPDKNLQIGDELGGGNFGVVYKGRLNYNGELMDVAVKTLKDYPTEKHWADFLNEIKLLQQLQPHGNMVRFIGAVTLDMVKTKKPKIIFELCDGGDLHSFLKKLADYNFDDEVTVSSGYTAMGMITDPKPSQGGLTYLVAEPRIKTRQLFQWCHEIAEGMEYLSSLGIVHRDIAARNILITRNLIGKIADLGLSKSLQKEGSSDYLNTSCYIPSMASTDVVPVRWVAIEALEENKYSEDSDIWAFGVLMWEIFNLCRCQPYSHISNDKYIISNLKEELTAGRRLEKPKFANNEIYEVMLQCWDQEKANRPRFSELKKLIRAAEAAMYANNNSSNQNNANYSDSYSESGGESDEIDEFDGEVVEDPPISYSPVNPVVIIPMTEEHEI